MAWRRPGDKPLSEPMLVSLSLGLHEVLMLNDVILPVYATAMPLIFKKKWILVPPQLGKCHHTLKTHPPQMI